jgi:hypothetical protein
MTKRSKPIDSLKTLKAKPSPPKRQRQTAREFLDLQRLMAGAVMRSLAAGGGMQSQWRDGRPMRKVAGAFIKPNDRLTSFERLEIYNRQYWFRIKDCFYDDYPGLRAILGERRFERLACAYLARHPSQSFTLRNLGRRLVEFLEAEPRWMGPLPHPALDMARLEWAHIEAFDNEVKPPLDVDSLLDSDPAQIRLQLQPHLTLLQLRYELDEFLIKAKQNEGLRSEASNAMELHRVHKRNLLKRHLRPKTVFLAVHRHNDTVYYKRLQPGQFRLLSAFQAKATLAEACDELAALALADLAQIKSWFESWAALGWFCKLE